MTSVIWNQLGLSTKNLAKIHSLIVNLRFEIWITWKFSCAGDFIFFFSFTDVKHHQNSWFHAYWSFTLEPIIQEDDEVCRCNSNNGRWLSINSARFWCFLRKDNKEGREISELWSEKYNYSCANKISILLKKSKHAKWIGASPLRIPTQIGCKKHVWYWWTPDFALFGLE